MSHRKRKVHTQPSSTRKINGEVTSEGATSSGGILDIRIPAQVCIPLCLIFATTIAFLQPLYLNTNNICHVSHENSNGKHVENESLLSYYDWQPSEPAGIYDPVDDSDYPYHVLKSFNPRKVTLDEREIVPLELKHKKKGRQSDVRVFIVDDLLSEEECDLLRAVHDLHIRNMSQYDPIICFDSLDTLRHHLQDLGHPIVVSYKDLVPGTRCINASFSSELRSWGLVWSHGTGFYISESEFSQALSSRIEQVVGFTQENGGAFRLVSYPQYTGYKTHTDCTLSGGRGIEDRYGTVLIYLDNVHIGGHTHFPELGISVKPKKGRGLVWNNMTPGGKCDPTSLHAADPVIKGHKYILQRWYYYQNFPGIEKRPPVPPKPARKPLQAQVSCDEYRNGSCRWYDTWTYDVLTHY